MRENGRFLDLMPFFIALRLVFRAFYYFLHILDRLLNHVPKSEID